MLALSADWRPGAPVRSLAEITGHPAIAHYVEGWPQPGDAGVVAEDTGAAWWRYFTADDPSFGFVDASVPEMSIAVVAHARGQGIGGALITALLELARAEGIATLSLSVEPDNPAVRLYERVGFRVLRSGGGSLTMLCPLAP